MDKIRSMGQGNHVTVTSDGATTGSIYVDDATPAKSACGHLQGAGRRGAAAPPPSSCSPASCWSGGQLVNQSAPSDHHPGFPGAAPAREALEANALDNAADEEAFKRDLMNVARGAVVQERTTDHSRAVDA